MKPSRLVTLPLLVALAGCISPATGVGGRDDITIADSAWTFGAPRNGGFGSHFPAIDQRLESLGVTSGGVFTTTAGTGRFVAAAGSVSETAFGFSGDDDTGLVWPASNHLDIVANGFVTARFRQSSMRLGLNALAFGADVTGEDTFIQRGDVGETDINATIGGDGNGVANAAIFRTGSYTVATLPTATAGRVIYITDETGGATLAFADGTNWRRCTDLAIVS